MSARSIGLSRHAFSCLTEHRRQWHQHYGMPSPRLGVAGQQCLRESNALNCMENVRRSVRARQLTSWTVSVDRCADRRQFCIHRVVVVDRAVAGRRDPLRLPLAQDEVTTGWPLLGCAAMEPGPWKVSWKGAPEVRPVRESVLKLLLICGCRFADQ